MHRIGMQIFAQCAVVSDDQKRSPAVAKRLQGFGGRAYAVHIKARIALVQDRKARSKYRKLKEFAPFFLAAGKPLVEIAFKKCYRHLKLFCARGDRIAKFL